MQQFLKDRPELRLKMRYNETLRSWNFEVYTDGFLHGTRPINSFTIYEDWIEQNPILSFGGSLWRKVYEMD